MTIAVYSLVFGAILVIFHFPIGRGFCRIGNKILKSARFEDSRHEARLRDAMNEQKAPIRMFILGSIFIAQGFFIWFFS